MAGPICYRVDKRVDEQLHLAAVLMPLDADFMARLDTQ
jgi:hypothetical protein